MQQREPLRKMKFANRNSSYSNVFSPVVFDLPSELFDCLLMHLPPLALQRLQNLLQAELLGDLESTYTFNTFGKKRGRCDIFNKAWERFFNLRWPELVTQLQPGNWASKQSISQHALEGDWRNIYWEMHLQNCLDEAVEVALVPSFSGFLSDIRIPDCTTKITGCEKHVYLSVRDCSKLSFHCQHFGYYSRCLRMQNVLCCSEICDLLQDSKLKSLVLCGIKSREHVDGLCKLLKQNVETIMALEFANCWLSSPFMDTICNCLCLNSLQLPMIQHFSIRGSFILETHLNCLPVGFLSLLTGRQLCSFKLCENYLGGNFAEMIFNTLLGASSSLTVLDISENSVLKASSNHCTNNTFLKISGCPANFKSESSSCSATSLVMDSSFQSLRELNIRGNNLNPLDPIGLKDALFHMPKLETLDISDNPITDIGLKNLFPYLVEVSKKSSHFSDLKLENCDLTCNGVTQLFQILSSFENPLSSLSIADNNIGSKISASLGNFLGNFIKVINIKEIGLGSYGFSELEKTLTVDVKLVGINISNNRGGIEAANFLSKFLLLAPDLVEVNAAFNLMPAECFTIIHRALEASKGKLKCLDLRGSLCHSGSLNASAFAKFQHNGKPVVLLSPASESPYDDDP